jgi:hypothetical protein
MAVLIGMIGLLRDERGMVEGEDGMMMREVK